MALADWSDLPGELTDLIANTSFDLFRLRSVCSGWRSSVTPKHRRLPSRFPILPNDNTKLSTSSFGFHLSKRTVFLVRSPQVHGQTDSITPSWLIKVEEDIPNRKRLLNPLKRQRFDFGKVLAIQNLNISEIGHEYVLNYLNYPANSNFSNEASSLYMEKVILKYLNSRESDSEGFVLLTVHVSGKLAMFKSEQKKWTILQHMPLPFDDVILYKGSFYAVDSTGSTVLVDYESCDVSSVANSVFGGDKKYLVECEGDLLLVDMYLRIDASPFDPSLDFEELLDYFVRERTVMFKVFRLDERKKEWVEVKDLHDNVLFLGEDCVFSASVSDLCVSKGNCVFFVDNVYIFSGDGTDDDCHHDIGVFDLESGCIKHLGDYPRFSELFWPPPEWITSSVVEMEDRIEELP